MHVPMGAERERLAEDARREKNWKRWGPYLSERQWGTVREDYSADGACWTYFPHDHARSRAYRWGEDGLLGICDREGRMCFAAALWNGRDPILKERLFGVCGPEANHGEDVKECYFYVDSTPTHSYMKALYKYPQAEFPYAWLLEENGRRGRNDPEFELLDTGVFQDDRYFDVFAEYAKAGTDDILIRITAINRGPDAATLHLLPTLWFRNTWSWGRTGEGYWPKPGLSRAAEHRIHAEHVSLGEYQLEFDAGGEALFTENETDFERLFGLRNASPYVKDSFHDYVIRGRREAVNPQGAGTKATAYYKFDLASGESRTVNLRLSALPRRGKEQAAAPGALFERRIAEADEFYGELLAGSDAARAVMRQAYAGLLWTKQFYHYSVADWLEGDPAQPPPPAGRLNGRNADWTHLYNRDVISMPDNWEYPWYAAWDLAFHMIPFAQLDPQFAKDQLVLLLREWYMHPNGEIPAYEFAFSDVNPPVHAWACWRVYKMTGPRGKRDRLFLSRVFQKLLVNFTWWVNRKDIGGKHIFAGGFLGLDNIGVFDRSRPLPGGGRLEQADGTAWMAFYCATMLSMALELAAEDPAYEDIASKFFEHFVAIADAMNTLGGTGLWDEEDGFYYDQLQIEGVNMPLRVRSMVGVIPLFAVEILDQETIEAAPGFRKRMEWFLRNRRDLARQISYMEMGGENLLSYRLLAIPSRERLVRVLRYLLDSNEFLSPYGIRSLSRIHRDRPFVLHVNGEERRVDYEPGESSTPLFGGNSNWRGPVWFPLNYLLIEALERYHHFYGGTLRVECPTGSGRMMNLDEVARELSRRIGSIFLPDRDGRIAWQGDMRVFADSTHWRNLTWFFEYFHGDTGRGCGASHQTGWTALIVRMLKNIG
jgi:Glycosyl hydrolase family 63 C-terminal domain